MNSLGNRETDLCIHGNWYKNGNDTVDPSSKERLFNKWHWDNYTFITGKI